jgi:predicted nuclease of predicted toxin-antitoxin system
LKLLFDQNLSRKLVSRLADIFPNSSHVQFHELADGRYKLRRKPPHTRPHKTDTEIWQFARENDFCIVTQDVDFAERSRLYGSPPKLYGYAAEMLLQTKLKPYFVLNLLQLKKF